MRLSAIAAVAALTGVACAVSPAEAQPLQAGTLTCSIAPGIGFVVGSQKEMTCTFQTSAAAVETYDGTVTKIGVDIGITNGAVVVWNVLTSGRIGPNSLAGSYVGATAEATASAGLGANVLVGGFNNSVTLQPLSVSVQTGLNVAAGVAEINLRPHPVAPIIVPPPPRR